MRQTKECPPPATGEDLAWLAGLLEGEGCFSHTKYCVRVVLAMTDEDVVRRAARLMDTVVHAHARSYGKPVWITAASGGKALGLIRTVRPFMGNRRGAKIDEILGWSLTRPGPAMGERYPLAVLSQQAVMLMRHLHRRGLSIYRIAKDARLVYHTVRLAIIGKTWSHVRYGLEYETA